jgi:quercetin dioxygenase-like cupin family protein
MAPDAEHNLELQVVSRFPGRTALHLLALPSPRHRFETPPTPASWFTPTKDARMTSRALSLALAALLSASAATAHAQKTAKLHWGPAPPFLPAGAKFALVSGDPGKSGPFVIELSLPNGYVIAPHFHPTDETVAVKSGHFRYGMGDKIDRKAEKTMKPGESGTMKTNMRHWARAQGPTVVAVSGNGPFLITYVNATDDPRNAKPKAK